MIATIVGVIGIGANMLIYQQKSDKKLLMYKMISDFLWALHYMLIDAYSACLIEAINIFREIVFYNNDKKWAKSKFWLIFFLLCSIISALFTFKNILNLLPAFASVLSVISFWRKNPDFTRALAYPISASMLIYDFSCLSYMGITNEIITIISTTVGMLRYKKECK